MKEFEYTSDPDDGILEIMRLQERERDIRARIRPVFDRFCEQQGEESHPGEFNPIWAADIAIATGRDYQKILNEINANDSGYQEWREEQDRRCGYPV